MNRFLELFIKGMPIGMSNTLPGISGGTIALVLKIYDELIHSIKKIKLKFLIPVVLGAVAGVFLGSSIIITLFESYPIFLTSFLLGLILASAKVTFTEVESFDIYKIILGLAGFFIAFLYSAEAGSVGNVNDVSLIKYFAGGAIGSVAMILPGISGGTILVMLGLYQSVLTAISSFNIIIILAFGIGIGSGLLLFSWLLSYLLDNYRSTLMAFLTGLIIGSTRSVIPAQFNLVAIFGLLLGITAILLLLRIE
jgi:putative membrane protein